MKLKFINLFLAVVTLLGATQILTSCKDTNEDSIVNLNQTLNERIKANEALISQLQSKIADIEANAANCPNKCQQAIMALVEAKGYQTKEDVIKLIGTYDFATNAAVAEAIQKALAEYAKTNDLNTIINNYFLNGTFGENEAVVAAVATALGLDGYLKTEDFEKVITGYYTKQEIDDMIAKLPTTSGLSKEEVEKIIEDLLAGKDYVTGAQLQAALADYYTKTEIDNMLKDYVKPADVTPLIAAYLASDADYQHMLDVTKQLDDALKALNGGEGYTVSEWFTYLENTLQTVKSDLAALDKDLNEKIQYMSDDIQTLYKMVGEALDFVDKWDPVLPKIQQNAVDALNLAQDNKGRLDAMDLLISNMDNTLQAYGADIANLKTAVADAQKTADDALKAAEDNLKKANDYTDAQIAALKEGYDATIDDLQKQLEAAQDAINGLDMAITSNKWAIEDLQRTLQQYVPQVDALTDRVSSIVLQGTYNSVLGALNTPFGVQSNVLMAFVGENTQSMAVSFPSARGNFEYDRVQVITDADYAILQKSGMTAETFESGDIFMNDFDGNLGKVYLTINPSNINLEGKTFDVVTSTGRVVPVKLNNLRPSTKELTFGYTRTATSENGFYEADATIAPKDASAIRLTIDQEVKSAAKEILNDRSLNLVDVLSLGNAIYNQMDGLLPALGIRAAWDENGTAQSVTSQYGIAATAFHPLSYGFLYGKSFRNIPIPNLGNIDFTLSTSGINFSLGSFNADAIDINGIVNKLKININAHIDFGGEKLEVIVPDYPYEAYVDPNDPSKILFKTREEKFYVDNFGDIADTINASLQQSFDAIEPDVQLAFKTALEELKSQIVASVDNMLKDVEVNVNSSLQSVIKDLNDQLNDKIGSLTGKFSNSTIYKQVQNVIKRLNKVLSDPNHYLQATMLYNNNGSYGHMSNTLVAPTVFTGTGNAVMLVPTTYTGEIATPAYKKFVAVTNVYRTNDHRMNAQAGTADCVKLLEQANAQPCVNEVIPGSRRTVPFYFEGGQGYTYEIVYQALDYSGVTSTQKVYVSIK